MLYLAETQKKSGFMGGGKAEFKLLAAQRSEHDWSSVPGEELIAAPDDAPYAGGVLVLIELTNNRQIKRHQEAGRTLVGVLQNFSSLSKKFKSQGEEIEQWKESLTYQSQALNRREMEIETRQDQVEQAEAELANFESQKQAFEAQQQTVEAQKAEVEQLQEELTRKNAELEGAWAHLNGEIQRFEERQEAFQAEESAGGVSDEQAAQIQAALTQIVTAEVNAIEAENNLQAMRELLAQQQADLSNNQQQLEQAKTDVEAGRETLEGHAATLADAKRSLTEAESALHSTQLHLQEQQALLGAKQEQNQLLTEQLKNQTDLHQRVYELLNATDKVRLSKKVDVASLEAMPEVALQTLVTNLEQDLDKMVRFVNDQEEELRLQQEDIDALKAKLSEVSEYDRLQLETEISEEKDRHVMLNRTLVGQRRNLLEREEVLSQHRAVLLRRQGLAAEGTGAAAELEPVLNDIDELRAGLGQQIQEIETESAHIQTEIDTLKQTRQQQQANLEAQQQRAAEATVHYETQLQTIGEAKGQVALYELRLSPVGENVTNLMQNLESAASIVSQLREKEEQQQDAIASAQQILQTLTTAEPAVA
ncbi:MAG: pilus motility taxis protein HmpF [Cyanobacteria bacterium J06626_6]